MCAIVTLDEHHIAAMSVMQMGNEDFFQDCKRTLPNFSCKVHKFIALLEVINEAFVMQGSLAAMTFPCYSDDLLATMQAFTSQHLYNSAAVGPLPAVADSDTFKWQFLSEMYRVLGLQYDYSVDAHPQQIIQNNVIQRCLATQASLGHAGAITRPSLPAIVARTTLELRYVAYCFIYSLRSKPGSDGELKNPGQSH